MTEEAMDRFTADEAEHRLVTEWGMSRIVAHEAVLGADSFTDADLEGIAVEYGGKAIDRRPGRTLKRRARDFDDV